MNGDPPRREAATAPMPALLLGLGFGFWGLCIGQPLLGGGIGLAYELLRATGARRQLSDAELRRGADLATLLTLAAFVYFLATVRLPGGLLRTVAWMPLTLLPLLLIARFGEVDGLRLRHVLLSLRRSRAPVADRPLPVEAPGFALLLVAGAAGSAAPAAPWFLPAASALAALGLFAQRPRQRSLGHWSACTVIALGLGAVVALGLTQFHTWLEERVIDWLSGADTRVERTTTRIGDLGRVKRSGAVVWRVAAKPAPDLPLLLFEAAYARYAGPDWLAAGESFTPLAPGADGRLRLAPEAGGEVRQLRLDGAPREREQLLPLPAHVLALDPPGSGEVRRAASGSLRLAEAPPWLTLAVDYRPAPAVAAAPPAPAYLALPAAERALLQRIAAGIATPPATPQQRIDALRRHFADGFRYSLELADGDGRRDLADFLERSRAGHCEYYATATTLLLRALGIPARYAVGFAVQEYDAATRTWVVRRRHAHAWAQAWVDGQWLDVDTTPGEWVAAEAAAPPLQPLFDRVAALWWQFGAWRAALDPAVPRNAALGLALIGLAVLAWRLRRRPAATPPPTRSVAAEPPGPLAGIEAELAARFGEHCRRRSGETPRRWLARLRREGCPGLAPPLFELAELNDRLRFAGEADPAPLRERMAALAATWRATLSATGNPRRP